jgi:cell pole-organizing protein PopZ
LLNPSLIDIIKRFRVRRSLSVRAIAAQEAAYQTTDNGNSTVVATVSRTSAVAIAIARASAVPTTIASIASVAAKGPSNAMTARVSARNMAATGVANHRMTAVATRTAGGQSTSRDGRAAQGNGRR